MGITLDTFRFNWSIISRVHYILYYIRVQLNNVKLNIKLLEIDIENIINLE